LKHGPGLVPVDRDAQRFELALGAGFENLRANGRDRRRQGGKIARGRRNDSGFWLGLGGHGLVSIGAGAPFQSPVDALDLL